MTLPTKAIFAALVLSLTPALASAQTHPLTNYGPGVGGAGVAGGSAPVSIYSPINGGQPIPTQSNGCGAQYLQSIVGLSRDSVPLPSGTNFLPAHVPSGFVFDPSRLTVWYSPQRVITRVGCG